VSTVGTGIVRRVAALTVNLTYREVEVVATSDSSDAPTLLVSNHFGGVADALLLIYLSPRFPRIVARDVIWSFGVSRAVMTHIEAIPVHKADDVADPDDARAVNDAMFSECYQALDDGSVVLIFPEGVTQDDPFLAPVKTGAARIVLGARAAGTSGIAIQPVGIHYEDKAAFRSRVLVAFGEPIDLDATMAGMTAAAENSTGRQVVDDLNTLIDRGMRAAAPDYEDWGEAGDLQLAATVALRQAAPESAVDDVPLALSERLGAALARRDAEARDRVRQAVQRYRSSLAGLRMSDYQLAGSASTLPIVGRLAVDLVLMVVLLPYALAGALISAIPYVLTQSTRLIPAAPAVRATVMPLVALVVFVLEWVTVAAVVGAGRGWQLGALVALLVPAFVGATVVVSERAVLAWRSLRRLVGSHRAGGPVTAARHDRAEVLSAVRDAL